MGHDDDGEQEKVEDDGDDGNDVLISLECP